MMILKSTRFFILILALLLLDAATAVATTLYASPTGGGTGASAASPATIASAISKSIAGDTIILDNGTYTLSGMFTIDREITLQGSGATVLDCSAVGAACLRVTTDAVLSDFAIENAPAGRRGSALKIENASPTVDGLEFSGNHIGIQINGATAAPQISATDFDGNTYGIIMLAGNGVTISDSVFDSHAGAGIFIKSAVAATVSGNTFNANDTGVWLKDAAGSVTATVTGNSFTGNRFGIRTEGNASGTNGTISANTLSTSTGAGLYVLGVAEASTIEANTFSGDNIGVSITTAAAPRVLNNLITSATTYGISSVGAAPTCAFNTVVASGSDGYNSQNSDNSLIANNIFYDNGSFGVFADSSSSATRVGNNDFYLNATGTYSGGTDVGNNSAVDPLFDGSGDYHLQATSPAIDAGDVTLASVTGDITGASRVAVSSSGTSAADLGAYEALPIFRLYYTTSGNKAYTQQAIQSAITLDGVNFTEDAGYRFGPAADYSDPDLFYDEDSGEWVLFYSTAMISPVVRTLYKATSATADGTFTLDAAFAGTTGNITSTVNIGGTNYVYSHDDSSGSSQINIATYDAADTDLTLHSSSVVSPGGTDPTVVQLSSGAYMMFYKVIGSPNSIYQSTSTDGLIWSAATLLVSDAEVPGAILANGTLYLYYTDPDSGEIVLITSTDDGVSWSAPQSLSGTHATACDPNPAAYR